MIIIKKTIILLLCLICISLPVVNYTNIEYSYADDDDGWMEIVTSALEADRKLTVAAVKAGLNIFGYKETFTYDINKAIFTWSYDKWDKVCRQAGLPGGIAQFNNTCKWRLKDNTKLQFYFDVTGLNDLNTLFQFLCDLYDIDTGYHKTIYSGGYFEDDDGNGCYVYVAPNTMNSTFNISSSNITDFVAVGTSLKYDNADLLRLVPNTNDYTWVSFNINQHTYTDTATNSWAYVNNIIPSRGPAEGMNVVTSYGRYWIYSSQPFGQSPLSNVYGEYTVIHFTKNDRYALGIMTHNMAWEEVRYGLYQFVGTYIDLSPTPQNVTAHHDDKPQPDLDKPAVIDTGDDDPDDFIKDNDPDVTVDQPTEPEQQPVPPDSVTPNPDNPTITPGNPDFDFQMPDLNIDWNLHFDGENMPFPFSIPYDIKRAFQKIDVEPEAPHFEGEVDLVITTWNIDIDFTDYNDYAEIIRKWFLFVFVLALIVATRSAMHIY